MPSKLDDKLTPNERKAVEDAVARTFSMTAAERLAAEVAVWRATHVLDARVAMLTEAAVKAIREQRTLEQRGRSKGASHGA